MNSKKKKKTKVTSKTKRKGQYYREQYIKP